MKRLFAGLLVVALSACARHGGTVPSLGPASPTDVFFQPAPFAYRVGPEVTSTLSDTADVRRDLGSQGAALGCDAVVDVMIARSAINGRARAWGFCAYRVD